MKQSIAVMQPYTFPYFGYLQLVASVDIFVFFDDVQYIRRGYINRNSILKNGSSGYFTIPIQKAARDAKIKDIQIHSDQYKNWKNTFLKTITASYKKAPFFKTTFELVQNVFDDQTGKIDQIAKKSIVEVALFLGLKTQFINSNDLEYDRSGSGQEKILSICNLLNAKTYVNPPGGKDLYQRESFQNQDIDLQFLQPQLPVYDQQNGTFVSGLSIIDQLMFMDKEEIKSKLNQHNLQKSIHEV